MCNTVIPRFASVTHLRRAAAASGENNIVDRDEDQFDEVADGSHDKEAHNACLEDLHVLGVVGFLALDIEVDTLHDKLLHLLG